MKIAILGAGIAGLSTGIALNKLGIKYTIYEAAEKIGPVGAGLGLGANAIKAFKELGIENEVIKAGRILSAFSIYDENGKIITRADSLKISAKYGIDNFTIHRYSLHDVLLKNAGPENVICNKRCVDYYESNNKIYLKFSDNTEAEADYLIVADGLNSPIRKKLLPSSNPRFAGYTCWRAVVPAEGLNINEAMEIWGSNGRIGIVPLANNQIYWFLCINSIQNNQSMRAFKTKDLLERFIDYPQIVKDVLKRTDDSKLIWGDICDLKPINSFAFGKVLLIGDAGHATTPNLGQGACQAVEDAVVLGKIIHRNENISEAFTEFESKRLKRTHFVVNKSWQIGKVAQWDKGLAIKFRNFILRSLPESFNEKQLEFLYNVNFD